MKRHLFCLAARKVSASASNAIARKVAQSKEQTILIPRSKSFEIHIMSGENGVYPVNLARIDECGFYGVDEGDNYNLTDIEDDDYVGFECCGMGYEEIEPLDICRIADYLSKRSKYEQRYNHILSKAKKIISIIPVGMTVILPQIETNYLDNYCDFQWGKFCFATKHCAITNTDEEVPWANFTTDDLILIADGIFEAIQQHRWRYNIIR